MLDIKMGFGIRSSPISKDVYCINQHESDVLSFTGLETSVEGFLMFGAPRLKWKSGGGGEEEFNVAIKDPPLKVRVLRNGETDISRAAVIGKIPTQSLTHTYTDTTHTPNHSHTFTDTAHTPNHSHTETQTHTHTPYHSHTHTHIQGFF